jgi:PAS domain S-box-containing protein
MHRPARLKDAMEAPLRADEQRRIAALRAFDVLDTPREGEFDEIVRVVAAICGTPIAAINLIDEGRQWFKAEVGLGIRETPLSLSICAHAILQPGLFMVPDTLTDTRFADNPWVIGQPGLRYYAGALLKTADNFPLGTVCVLDFKPRRLNEDQKALLTLMANQVVKMFELRRSRALERTARVEAERLLAKNDELLEAVRQSDQRLRQTLKAGGLGYWSLDLGNGMHDASENLKFDFGHGFDQTFSYENFPASIHPDDRGKMVVAVENTIRTGADFEVTCKTVGKDGSVRAMLMRAQLHRDIKGSPESLSGIAIDVSDLKHIERQLAESEDRLSLALNAAGTIGTWDWDIPSDMVYADAAFVRLCGLRPESVRGPQPRSALRYNYHPEDLPTLDSAISDALAGRSDYDVEYRILTPGGDVRWLNAKGKVARDDLGNPIRFQGASVDITERKNAEDHRRLLMNELSHRVRNTLSMVQAITAQTLKSAPSLEEADKIISSRLRAMAHAHDILLQEKWASANIRTIAEATAQLLGSYDHDRFDIEGPDLYLNSQHALSFALVMHELGTNAVKYGALSNIGGQVKVAWNVGTVAGEQHLHFEWRELGGPEVHAPTRMGFGSRLIKSSLASMGSVEMFYERPGFSLHLDAPLKPIQYLQT